MINDVACSKNDTTPKILRKVTINKKSESFFNKMFIFTLCHPILLRCIITCNLMENTMRRHELFKKMGKIFTIIITSQSLNRNIKLSFNFIKKRMKYIE